MFQTKRSICISPWVILAGFLLLVSFSLLDFEPFLKAMMSVLGSLRICSVGYLCCPYPAAIIARQSLDHDRMPLR
jgi:hypothetical protein